MSTDYSLQNLYFNPSNQRFKFQVTRSTFSHPRVPRETPSVVGEAVLPRGILDLVLY